MVLRRRDWLRSGSVLISNVTTKHTNDTNNFSSFVCFVSFVVLSKLELPFDPGYVRRFQHSELELSEHRKKPVQRERRATACSLSRSWQPARRGDGMPASEGRPVGLSPNGEGYRKNDEGSHRRAGLSCES